MLVGVVLVFSPETLVDNVQLGVAPTWRDFILAIPIGMLAYTGIETISNLAEEARDETKTIPIAINRVRIAVFAIYFTLPVDRAVGAARRARRRRRVLHAARPARGGGRLRRRPDPRRRQADRPRGAADRRARSTSACSRPRSSSSPPTRALIGVSRLVYSMGIHRQLPDRLRQLHPKYRTPWIGILLFSGIAIGTILPGPGGLPRQPLRVRRAAVVHVRARLRGAAAGEEEGRRRGPTAARAT